MLLLLQLVALLHVLQLLKRPTAAAAVNTDDSIGAVATAAAGSTAVVTDPL